MQSLTLSPGDRLALSILASEAGMTPEAYVSAIIQARSLCSTVDGPDQYVSLAEVRSALRQLNALVQEAGRDREAALQRAEAAERDLSMAGRRQRARAAA